MSECCSRIDQPWFCCPPTRNADFAQDATPDSWTYDTHTPLVCQRHCFSIHLEGVRVLQQELLVLWHTGRPLHPSGQLGQLLWAALAQLSHQAAQELLLCCTCKSSNSKGDGQQSVVCQQCWGCSVAVRPLCTPANPALLHLHQQ